MKKILLFLSIICLFFSADNPESRLQQYIDEHLETARYCQSTYCVPVSITLARSIMESGGGVSEVAQKSNNHFGIMFAAEDYFGKSGGEYWLSPSGNKWRKYESVKASFIDHAMFFSMRKESACRWPFTQPENYRIWSKTIGWCIAGHGAENQAEAAKAYENALNQIIQRYKLDRFDKQDVAN